MSPNPYLHPSYVEIEAALVYELLDHLEPKFRVV